MDVARSRNRDGVNGEGFGVWLTRSGSRIVKFLTRIFVRSIASVMLESAAYLDGIVRPHADRGQQVAKTARKKLCRDGEVAEIVEHMTRRASVIRGAGVSQNPRRDCWRDVGNAASFQSFVASG